MILKILWVKDPETPHQPSTFEEIFYAFLETIETMHFDGCCIFPDRGEYIHRHGKCKLRHYIIHHRVFLEHSGGLDWERLS